VFIDDRAVHTDAWRRADAFAPPGLQIALDDRSDPFAELPVTPPLPAPVVLESGRTFAGIPLRLEQHVTHALALATAAGIRRLPSSDSLAASVRAALVRTRARPDVTFDISIAAAGRASHVDGWRGAAEAQVLVACRPLPEVAAGLARMRVPAAPDAPPAFAARVLGEGAQELDAPGPSSDAGMWPLYAGADGCVRSALGGALGVVCGGVLTLDPGTGLPEVMTRWLVDVARRVGVPVRIAAPELAELRRASEVLLAASPFCLLPIGSLDGRRLEPAPGPLAVRLRDAWGAETGLDLGAQLAGCIAAPPAPSGRPSSVRRSSRGATVVIPARLASTRLPRKVLADIGGRPMIEHVHDVAVRAGCGRVVVLTDDHEVAAAVRAFGGEAWLTSAEHESGTARIASVLDRLESQVVVNLQGDAPLTDPAVVASTAAAAARTPAGVTMPVYAMRNPAEAADPSVVKVVRGHDGRVLYCSRSAIPSAAAGPVDGANFWVHAGLYGYSRDFLQSFPNLPVSPLEQAERLEQLRWLEAGVQVHSFVIDPQGPSVDTAADLERVRRSLTAPASV